MIIGFEVKVFPEQEGMQVALSQQWQSNGKTNKAHEFWQCENRKRWETGRLPAPIYR